MKIFLTGNRGKIGTVIENDLHSLGHEVIGYDRLEGKEILDIPLLNATVKGCNAVIHLAGLDTDSPSSLNLLINLSWRLLG